MGTVASRVVVGTISAGVSFIALGGVGGATGELAPPAVEVLAAQQESVVVADAAPSTVNIESAESASSTDASSPATSAAPTTSIALTPASAFTSTTTTIADAVDRLDDRPQRLGSEALALVRFDWSGMFPDWTIEFHTSRDGLRALTYPHEQRIEVFVRTSDDAESLHRVIAHELGHVIDVEWNDEEERSRWRVERGIAGDVPWWPGESKPDFATGAGDFAEAFAVWEAGITSQSSVAGALDQGDLDLLTQLVGV
ncbi:MAG: hypothetical protein ACR2P0_10180 [Acidimicrobiales bacterium]